MGERDYVYALQCDQEEADEERRVAAAERELVDRYREIERKREENEFLGVVLADYQRYFEHIRGEKQRQYEAMRGLTDYIQKLTSEMDTASHILRETKHDQEALLREMVKVKGQIDKEIPKVNFEA